MRELCEGLCLDRSLKTLFVYQVVLDLLHASVEKVCVLEPRTPERNLATSRWSDCIFCFHLIQYSGMPLSHKITLILSHNSLIICIGCHWIYFAIFTLVGLCCLGPGFTRAPERSGNNRDLRKQYKVCHSFLLISRFNDYSLGKESCPVRFCSRYRWI